MKKKHRNTREEEEKEKEAIGREKKMCLSFSICNPHLSIDQSYRLTILFSLSLSFTLYCRIVLFNMQSDD